MHLDCSLLLPGFDYQHDHGFDTLLSTASAALESTDATIGEDHPVYTLCPWILVGFLAGFRLLAFYPCRQLTPSVVRPPQVLRAWPRFQR